MINVGGNTDGVEKISPGEEVPSGEKIGKNVEKEIPVEKNVEKEFPVKNVFVAQMMPNQDNEI